MQIIDMPNPNLKLVANERAHRRVKVALRGALCIPGSAIALVRTCNISEGGIALAHHKSKLPAAGTPVKLQLDGVLSNGPEKNFDVYEMKVVYANRNEIGLSFEDKASNQAG